MTRRQTSQSGSVFTILLAGIAIAGALSVVLYSTISGPMSSMVRVTNKTTAKSQMQSIANILIMDAVNNLPNNGDCASAGFVVPRSWRPGTVAPIGGGLIPTTIGAPITDPWGTDYGYCVWEVGITPQSPACGTTNGFDQSCQGLNGTNTCAGGNGGSSCAGSSYNGCRLLGTPTPTSGNANTQYVFAIISAGPDRKFSTTCNAYNSSSPTNPLVTTGNDDIVQTYTYQQASTATSSLWTLNPSSLGTAVIDKNLAVGPTASPTFQVNATTGAINALSVVTTGAILSRRRARAGFRDNVGAQHDGLHCRQRGEYVL